jgi:hypothetical protein
MILINNDLRARVNTLERECDQKQQLQAKVDSLLEERELLLAKLREDENKFDGFLTTEQKQRKLEEIMKENWELKYKISDLVTEMKFVHEEQQVLRRKVQEADDWKKR